LKISEENCLQWTL